MHRRATSGIAGIALAIGLLVPAPAAAARPEPHRKRAAKASTFAVGRKSLTFVDKSRPTKFLLTLLDAPHTPFTNAWKDPIIATTVAFLDGYLKHDRTATRRMNTAGNVEGVATLEAVRR